MALVLRSQPIININSVSNSIVLHSFVFEYRSAIILFNVRWLQLAQRQINHECQKNHALFPMRCLFLHPKATLDHQDLTFRAKICPRSRKPYFDRTHCDDANQKLLVPIAPG
jgi:hypothetical protein